MLCSSPQFNPEPSGAPHTRCTSLRSATHWNLCVLGATDLLRIALSSEMLSPLPQLRCSFPPPGGLWLASLAKPYRALTLLYDYSECMRICGVLKPRAPEIFLKFRGGKHGITITPLLAG